MCIPFGIEAYEMVQPAGCLQTKCIAITKAPPFQTCPGSAPQANGRPLDGQVSWRKAYNIAPRSRLLSAVNLSKQDLCHIRRQSLARPRAASFSFKSYFTAARIDTRHDNQAIRITKKLIIHEMADKCIFGQTQLTNRQIHLQQRRSVS